MTCLPWQVEFSEQVLGLPIYVNKATRIVVGVVDGVSTSYPLKHMCDVLFSCG